MFGWVRVGYFDAVALTGVAFNKDILLQDSPVREFRGANELHRRHLCRGNT